MTLRKRLVSLGGIWSLCALYLALFSSDLARASEPTGMRAPAVRERGPSAAKIVEAAIEASGGTALDRVRTVRRHGSMHLESDLFGTLEGSWEVAFAPGVRGFQRVDFGSAVTTTVWDGASVWEDSMSGLRDLNDEELALNLWLWELNPLHALVRDGRADSLQRLADETIGGARHYVLEAPAASGGDPASATRVYVDAETFLVGRIASSIFIPGIGRCTVHSDYSEYRDFDGVQLPVVTHQVLENLWVYDARFDETEIGPQLPDALFARPGS